ncbi:hypothetical protein [Terracoccus sp. 273MFTsu3.1]|uniref:hypothetical protein n=1 Tax=Terracoccus sp. 273MFTsu3.1 TaxID=1172188 RepID=UPI00035D6F61|nr:hypothetical protein [Terracoccus sp. 273MFTsu3.1]
MTFNINNQNAGTINNVDGDQHVHGGQRSTVRLHQDLNQGRDAVADLRSAIDACPEATADPVTRHEARCIDEALEGEEPDRAAAASALERLTQRLRSLGALASAGAALVEPIRALAGWLGPLASGVSTMLPL